VEIERMGHPPRPDRGLVSRCESRTLLRVDFAVPDRSGFWNDRAFDKQTEKLRPSKTERRGTRKRIALPKPLTRPRFYRPHINVFTLFLAYKAAQAAPCRLPLF
jgi:hypothetical protein